MVIGNWQDVERPSKELNQNPTLTPDQTSDTALFVFCQQHARLWLEQQMSLFPAEIFGSIDFSTRLPRQNDSEPVPKMSRTEEMGLVGSGI